jgi:ABC-type glycerol-3-phosphate transport system permease component
MGITLVPSVAEHPISEALFNFVNAWSMMLLPLIMVDRKAESMESKYPLWFGIQFLTNVFCIPYLALREQQVPRSPELPTKTLPSWTPLVS